MPVTRYSAAKKHNARSMHVAGQQIQCTSRAAEHGNLVCVQCGRGKGLLLQAGVTFEGLLLQAVVTFEGLLLQAVVTLRVYCCRQLLLLRGFERV
jgi:hypothetical protein